MKIGYLDCFSGISGDMFLGALVDAGVPLGVMQQAVDTLGLQVQLTHRRVDRSGIDSAKVDVLTEAGAPVDGGLEETEKLPSHLVAAQAESKDHGHFHTHVGDEFAPQSSHSHEHTHTDGTTHSHHHAPGHVHGRSLSAIQDLIRSSELPIAVQTTAMKAFELLGAAEAKIHNVPVETIHFHEVGAVDAIADIVAASTGAHWLQVDNWICSPLNVGGGHVHCAHGQFPVPAPATLELLRDLPVYSSGLKKELVTPTGAALLRALEVTSSDFPPMRMSATGYGAGSRDTAGKPNVLRLVIGESTTDAAPRNGNAPASDRVGIIETTIDDATPELLSYAADRLLAAGASDVYRTPIQMKKGRIGIQLTVICSPAKAEELQRIIFAETTTLGLRYRIEEKKSLARTSITVETEWGAVRMKIGKLESGEIVNHAPEYEDCRRLAEVHGIPLKQVMQAATSSYFTQEVSA